MPSRVKDASSVNKITLNSSGRAFTQYVEHDRLVPDVVFFDRGKGINRPRVMFATPAYVIHQCERPFYEWTDVESLHHLKNVLSRV